MEVLRSVITLVILCGGAVPVKAVRMQGKWNTGEFFHYITKFGFQKTSLKNHLDTQGYVFGNITTENQGLTKEYTFALLDRGYFLSYYGNSSLLDREKACQLMFKKIDHTAYDSVCNDEGKEDFLRRIPCPKGSICIDEDQPVNVIAESQLTFAVQDLVQPRFWYLSLVACARNTTTCSWEPVPENITISYDLWLVNGNPRTKGHSLFEYHFSVDIQGIAEIYIVCFVCYGLLTPLQLYAIARQKHAIPRLFTASLILVSSGLFFNVIQSLEFAGDGTGIDGLQVTGDILDILSQTLFMLVLLLLAKGWAITQMEITNKPFLFAMWLLYGVVHVLLYFWDRIEVAVIEDINPYQTWPGWLILVLRVAIMAWFLLCLRDTMRRERNQKKLDFFLHFAASSLVWFIYLPIVALISFQVSPLFRQKLLIGIVYSANFLANVSIMHLLWPTRSEQYFLLSHVKFYDDELEEFNEAPHVVNSAVNHDSGSETYFDMPAVHAVPSVSTLTNVYGSSSQELIRI